jgi:plastocyanin
MDRLFGTNAPLFATISLALSLLVAVLLTVGLFLARARRYGAHRWVQTAAVLLNAGLVAAVMLGSFAKSVTPGIPARVAQPYYALGLVHGLAGLVALLFGGFVMLRANGLVPRALQFNSYKPFMRWAYGLYMAATALGVALFAVWYGPAARPAAEATTIVQREGELIVPMVDFTYSPKEIVVPAGTTVIWVNQDGAPHNAIADDGSFATDLLALGERSTTTFSAVGEFPFYCDLHGAPGGVDMAGLVRVLPADQAPPAVADQAQPEGARPHLDSLLTAGAGLPARQGYATGLRLQADELANYARLTADAYLAGDTEGLRRHGEHVYNLVAGSLDPRFGDLNGDTRPQNPGDGFGLLPNGAQPGYIAAVATAAEAAAAAPDATEELKLHAGHVLAATENLQLWADEARTLALKLSTDESAGEAEARRLLDLAARIQTGLDTNGDGQIAPVVGEAGARVAYEHANFMAGLLEH